ncbi:hypothetical protein CMI45_01335 [Candidatus Pacearchaeota archaeon]|nr:hypothetical protein [Candidatus Pacearchaeota archaeon]|tara:strand:- start:797 stop:1516 length:720 start_codon:yes stop_codon:yes gene_type:complete
MEPLDFTRFFEDKNYLKLKNNLFNYLNRKRLLKHYSKKYIKHHQRIADIGSGISPVSPKPEKTLFIDISSPALDVLKKQGHKTLYGSITNLPISNNTFDSIFCSEVLEHVEDYLSALSELHRILNPKGIAFITVPCWMHYWNIDDEFVGHHRRFHPNKFRERLQAQGFNVLEVKKIGSKLDRLLTLQTVKQFDKAKKINSLLVNPYIAANHLLSYAITLSTFFSEDKLSNIFLFICQKD